MFKKATFLLLLLAVCASASEGASIYERIIGWYNSHLNYASVCLLMTIESSFVPFPSELVVPPAVYQALQPGSTLRVPFILVAASAGSLLGAFINYFLAKYLGRPVIYKLADSRLGRLCLIDSAKVERAETFFRKYGVVSTLVGRLITVVRQLISIPAGLAKMNFLQFTLCTFVGATIWNIVLCLLGYLAHGQKDLIEKYNGELSLAFVVLAALFIAYVVIHAFRKKSGKAPERPEPPAGSPD